MYPYILLLFAILATACGRENNRLETALKLAGGNRKELQKVLEYYANDSLKLKAAVFLIENMPGHCSYVSDELTAIGFKQRYESLFFDKYLMPDQKKTALEQLSVRYNLEANIAEDAEIITADFLIDNIERSFKTWKNGRYCQHLNFDEFCELILPYKCAELQEMDDWKARAARVYDKLNLVVPNDETWSNPQQAACILTKYFGPNKRNHVLEYTGYTLYNKNTLIGTRFGTCKDYSLSAVALMRSKGIPACLEMIPLWGQGSQGHSWHTILNDNGLYMPAPWNWNSLPGDVFFPKEKIPKIFRHTYAADPFFEAYSEQSSLKLGRFHKFQKDVTGLYLQTSDVEIPVKTAGIQEKYAYLALFDNTGWTPVDVGVLKRGKARFDQVGRRIAYIVLGYDGEKLLPISEPFILDRSGRIDYCTPQTVLLDSVKLIRKFPKKERTALAEQQVVGGQIHAANRSNFFNADTLFVIKDPEYPDLIPLDSTKRYRYWRFSQEERDRSCSLAELQFFAPGGPEEPVKGKTIASEYNLCIEDHYSDEPVQRRTIVSELETNRPEEVEKIFDGDWLTSYTCWQGNGWVGLDFGRPVALKNVRVVPRSDDNGIHCGDLYELKYWRDGWVSLGKQVATEKYLLFNSVPQGALLLLSNKTRGKEERIFTYEQGRVRWW